MILSIDRTKISKTAFQDKATLFSGYGKRMQNTSISDDTPTYFLNPDRVNQPTSRMTRQVASITKIPPSNASYILPAGESVQLAITNPPINSHKRFRTFPHTSFRTTPQVR